ncbi:MAG: hypothetical protein BroJett025_00970 [Patescibacteria group bacterium]|nr:MAG: hypothetical protein BroJett025_00970 [Patescibacteria group bacterium]
MKRKQLAFKMFFVLIVVIIVAISSSTKVFRQDSNKVEKVTIGIVGDTSSLVVFAKEKGYFLDQGLDVEIKQYAVGAGALNDLLSGNIDIAVGSEHAGVRSSFNSDKFKIGATIAKTTAFEIVARRDRGITNPQDIMGKTVGSTSGTAGEFWLSVFLRSNQMSRDDIDFISLSPAELPKALTEGKIDAMLNLEPHTYNAKVVLGENAVSFRGQRGQGVYSGLYFSNNLLERQPVIPEKIIRALVMAEGFFNENREESLAIISEYFGHTIEYIENVVVPKYEFEVSLEQALILTMEDQARWMVDTGIVEVQEIPNFLNYFYFDALQTVKPESVTIVY